VLARREIIAPGIADLVLAMRSPSRLEFKAGQFVSLAVGEPLAGGEPIPRRSYSIASQSDAGAELRFIIRVIPEGTASGFLMSLPMGATVNLTGPHGFFMLDVRHAGDVVFGATGTGIAAVMPMLGELARRPETGRRVVFWGVRQEPDLFAREEIAALAAAAGAELSLHLTAPAPGWSGARGRITPAVVDALPALRAPTFYLVGNGAMITELKHELVTRGVNRKSQIRTEAFFD
jgi:ferredoxin-NADP reductase